MTTFDERESAYENKFVRDAEIEFLAYGRRDKLLAYWAAELMGKTPREAALYARNIIHIDLGSADDQPVRDKLATDLEGLASAGTVAQKMDELMAHARAQIETGS